MRWNKSLVGSFLLVALFLLVAFFRIVLAFQTPVPDYEGFRVLLQVDQVLSSSWQDVLVSGTPLFPFLLAFFGLFLPKLWLVKVVPNIFAATAVFPAYSLGRVLSQHRRFGLFSALFVGVVPAFVLAGLNDGSSLGLSVTLLLSALFLFVRVRSSKVWLRWLLLVLSFLMLLQMNSFVLLFGLLWYLLLLRLLQVKVSGKDVEVTLFYLFSLSWLTMVLWKRSLVAHGLRVIWQNIPQEELSHFFSHLTLVQVLVGSGLLTLLLGSYALYQSVMVDHRKPLLLLTGMLFATIILLWMRALPLRNGLALLSVLLAVASSYALQLFSLYLMKTKAARFTSISLVGVALLFLLIALPSDVALAQEASLSSAPAAADVALAEWASSHLPVDAVILASPQEGFFLEATAHRKVVLDEDYLFQSHVEERYLDSREVYQAVFKTDAVGLMQKYGASYLWVSLRTKEFSGVLRPSFLREDDCFRLVRDEQDDAHVKVWLYERVCSLRSSEVSS